MIAGGSLFQIITVDWSVVGYSKVKSDWLFLTNTAIIIPGVKLQTLSYIYI